jgi:lysophospholipase L1-like esterase
MADMAVAADHSPLSSGRRHKLAIAALLFGGVAAGIALGELGLRIAGFSFPAFPGVQFGFPNPQQLIRNYVPDPALFWVPTDYAARIAKARAAPPTIVFMGDSCTEFGTYPQETMQRLSASLSPPMTSLTIGIAGHSSEQGLAQLRRDVMPLRPKLVSIYYGWNDHWAALGPPDSELQQGPLSFWFFQKTRLGQLWGRLRQQSVSPVGRPPRVSEERYYSNLKEMIRLVASWNGRSVIITAPSNHIPGSEPQYLAARHLGDVRDLIKLHTTYAAIARRAAAENGALLCDAADAFDKLPDRRRFFMRDGIHLNPAGGQYLGAFLSECIGRLGDTHEASGPGKQH